LASKAYAAQTANQQDRVDTLTDLDSKALVT
jgi:hypothetical protein